MKDKITGTVDILWCIFGKSGIKLKMKSQDQKTSLWFIGKLHFQKSEKIIVFIPDCVIYPVSVDETNWKMFLKIEEKQDLYPFFDYMYVG